MFGEERDDGSDDACGRLAVLGCASGALGVTAGQVDDFETGTVEQWQNGPPSPNQPTVMSEAGNSFLRVTSSGGSGAGSRMAVFNRAQWAGGYTGEGVDSITFDARNLGGTTLFLRIGLRGAMGSTAGTIGSFTLAPGGWTSVTIDITDLMQYTGFGIETPAQILASSSEMRIYSAQNLVYQGDAVAGVLDLDNITADVGVAACPADFTDDGVVDASDLAVLARGVGGVRGRIWI